MESSLKKKKDGIFKKLYKQSYVQLQKKTIIEKEKENKLLKRKPKINHNTE
eukprot:CAMPEP_0170541444 /NCGR_PEP_ID=MMETSP0211-20121228/1169_1 /TAXON_ID=311385 /ORGANISM="Pseudokeronopsis sp., Strain OXSARD2" /LENGTH=50 /DNA_ID=CAMNT_0010844163 /DNA_START=1716 /DNA_END=1868 /DNA_ORIENTATION=-